MNKAYPTGWKGRRYLDPDALAFKVAVAYHLVNKIPWTVDIKDRFRADVTFRFQDKRRRDIDDYFKLFLDALTVARVWHDDRQVEVLIGRKEQGCDQNEIALTVEKL